VAFRELNVTAHLANDTNLSVLYANRQRDKRPFVGWAIFLLRRKSMEGKTRVANSSTGLFQREAIKHKHSTNGDNRVAQQFGALQAVLGNRRFGGHQRRFASRTGLSFDLLDPLRYKLRRPLVQHERFYQAELNP